MCVGGWYWRDGLCFGEGERGRGDLRIKGPSDSAIPSALPPFLENWAIVFLVIGCRVIAGRTLGASLMLETASLYMERISWRSETEGLKVAVI